MKTFKLLDSLISAFLICIAIISTLIRNHGWDNGSLFYWYFVIGGWQVISMIIHEWNKWFIPEGSIRRLYHRIVAWIVIIFIGWVLVGTISGEFCYAIVIYLYLLLLFTPVMAIFYTALCFMEWKGSHPKPMAKLNN